MLYTDDEDEEDYSPPATTSKPTKRAKTEETEDTVEVDIDEEEVNVDDEDPSEDTRFLPPESSTSKRSSSKKPKSAPKRPKKRAVVLSDDDGEDDYAEREDIVIDDDDDDDFTPEPTTSKRAAPSKAKGKTTKTAADKPITVKDERRGVPSRSGPSFPGKRGVLNDDGDEDDSTSKADSVEAAPPPPKKPKLPPIKKNKPSTGTSTPTGLPAKLPPKPAAVDKDGLALGVAGARKPAATANNADFDLRDASVYASLFMKPGGATPNSGLSRKEKEEERRKELNKMREEARRKREAGLKNSFDLQAAQEKIARFESRLRSRLGHTSATYPNVLCGALKDDWERARIAYAQQKLAASQ